MHVLVDRIAQVIAAEVPRDPEGVGGRIRLDDRLEGVDVESSYGKLNRFRHTVGGDPGGDPGSRLPICSTARQGDGVGWEVLVVWPPSLSWVAAKSEKKIRRSRFIPLVMFFITPSCSMK